MALNLNRQKSEKPNVVIPTSLTQSSGTITAVMGTKVYTVVTSGLAANTRYQLYIVPGGTLVYSTNENSVGPAGYTSWILVGSFYSNGLASVGFGSFIDVINEPATRNQIFFTPLVQGFVRANAHLESALWSRDKGLVKIDYNYRHVVSTGASTSSNMRWRVPGNLTIDESYILGSNPAFRNSGTANAVFGGIYCLGVSTYYGSDYVTLNVLPSGPTANIASTADLLNTNVLPMGGNSAQVYSFKIELPVVGWSNTPIAYL